MHYRRKQTKSRRSRSKKGGGLFDFFGFGSKSETPATEENNESKGMFSWLGFPKAPSIPTPAAPAAPASQPAAQPAPQPAPQPAAPVAQPAEQPASAGGRRRRRQQTKTKKCKKCKK